MSRKQEALEARKDTAKPGSPKLRPRSRLMETLDHIHRSKVTDRRSFLIALGAATVAAACAPLTSVAQDTTPKRSPKEPASAVEKSEVTYETFSDPEELEPYFKNAEGKFVKIRHDRWTKVGDYLVRTDVPTSGVDFNIRAEDGSYEKWGITFASPLNEVNVLVVDMGDSNPYIKGKMLVLTDRSAVYFQYFNKRAGRHELRGIPLWEGKMRQGPIKTGLGIDADGVFVLNAPKDLKPGDVVCQAGLWNDGSSGPGWFKFIPPSEGSKTVALR